MENLTTETFKEKVFDYTKINEENQDWNIKGNKPIVLKFSADSWCMPCKAYAPVYEEFSKEKEDISFYSIDVDEQPELAGLFGVRSVPTTVFLPVNGEQPRAAMGTLTKEKLNEIIDIIV